MGLGTALKKSFKNPIGALKDADKVLRESMTDPSIESFEDIWNPLIGGPDLGLAGATGGGEIDISKQFDEALGGVPPTPEEVEEIDTSKADEARRRALVQSRGRRVNIFTSGRGLTTPALTASTQLLGG